MDVIFRPPGNGIVGYPERILGGPGDFTDFWIPNRCTGVEDGLSPKESFHLFEANLDFAGREGLVINLFNI